MGKPQRTAAEIVILKPAAAEDAAVTAAIKSAQSVGAKLAGARKAKGYSLDDVHVGTKVKAATLAAIESADRASLPAVPFTAGFIKAYAQFLGLDPEEYARSYRIEVGAVAPSAAPTSAIADVAPLQPNESPAPAGLVAIAPALPKPAIVDKEAALTPAVETREPTPTLVAIPVDADDGCASP